MEKIAKEVKKNELEVMVGSSGKSKTHIAKAMGRTRQYLCYKLKNPESLTCGELNIIFDELNLETTKRNAILNTICRR